MMSRMGRRGSEDERPGPVEEAGETTAADSIPTPVDSRPVGEGTRVEVEGDEDGGG
jgi:hypothetical protein